MEEIKTLIEKYKAENAKIIKKRPDLQFNNDFSLEGCRLDSNVAFIKELSGLAKRLNENGGLHKHIVNVPKGTVCGKPNCNRLKLDNSPLCAYHWDIANS